VQCYVFARVTLLEYLLLIVTAALGGALNSVAGGGSFLSFPALVFVGIAPVTANATNALALWPGSLAGAIAYRKELARPGRRLFVLALLSTLGGLLGGILLLRTPNATFVRVLPYLLLVAALLFTFGDRITAWLRRAPGSPSFRPRMALIGGAFLQFVIAAYGGYFGGGMGIMMLATFSVMGMTNIHAMNALKTALATVINLIAISAFVVAGAVAWRPGLVMMIAATFGGYFGATAARRIDPIWIRRFVLVVAWAMTTYFFYAAYGPRALTLVELVRADSHALACWAHIAIPAM